MIHKQVVHGKNFALNITHKATKDEKFVVACEVDVVFPWATGADSSDLLMAVSLVGECVGSPRVYPSAQSLSDWTATQAVGWELLPVKHGGSLPQFSEVAANFKRRTGRDLPDTYEERYTAMAGLQADKVWTGVSGFHRYMAFDFGTAVVLENFSYGNAAYVMFDDWRELSQRSRPDLLADQNANYVRIVHRNGWAKRVRAEIEATR
ncbi:hypothetical protein E7744_02775 [Citricoccus sp. SGAir0253]|uniref:hypothetical protein n=1 Tax=Citricoccus sp. SGAir0253 TaxID=2567881 RepID=UPI0010CD10AE|nr:hypothetical protein [Citricoccus sp. SGAir0253]QCU77260.1 hypothetical protein E7744_02775 [Citricoccus sp. SGAir0253]